MFSDLFGQRFPAYIDFGEFKSTGYISCFKNLPNIGFISFLYDGDCYESSFNSLVLGISG